MEPKDLIGKNVRGISDHLRDDPIELILGIKEVKFMDPEREYDFNYRVILRSFTKGLWPGSIHYQDEAGEWQFFPRKIVFPPKKQKWWIPILFLIVLIVLFSLFIYWIV